MSARRSFGICGRDADVDARTMICTRNETSLRTLVAVNPREQPERSKESVDALKRKFTGIQSSLIFCVP